MVGGHKAAAIAIVLKNARIFLVSDLDDATVEKAFMSPFKNVQSAFDVALKEKGKDAQVIVMPWAGSTLPRMRTV